MNKEFVPYEQALALKELEFDKPCLAYWNTDPLLNNPAFNLVRPFDHVWCLPAPLYQQAFRWFREKYGYFYNITYFDPVKAQVASETEYQGGVYFPHQGYHYLPEKSYATYEEAEIACLKKLIELTKENQNEKKHNG